MTYKCKFCNSGFWWQEDYRKHLQEHMVELVDELEKVTHNLGLHPHYQES